MKSNKKTAEIFDWFQRWKQPITEGVARNILTDFERTWKTYEGVFTLIQIYLYPSDCLILAVQNSVKTTLYIKPGQVEVISTDFSEVEKALFKYYMNECYDFEE